MALDLDPQTVALDWLSLCNSALCSADREATIRLFLPNGWLRDLLVFTWDIHSLEGRDKLRAYLYDRLDKAHISDVQLTESEHLSPREFTIPQIQAIGVELAFTFQCHHGHGRGIARLLCDTDGVFRAYTLLTELADLVGHEEISTLRFKDDLADNGRAAVPKKELDARFAKWKHAVETNPQVIIVGAGQTGVQVAARFKQMNIPSLVIERHARVGDQWRKRYPSLVLHTTRGHHSLLYQPFPTNWPDFTPADKLADWIEYYAFIQDVTVWTKTVMKPRPTYDKNTHTWDVTVVRDGIEVKMRPAHIILATGTVGRAYTPEVRDMERFRGDILHSGDFPGGAAYVGKRVVVVGAGNSSIDICQDLVYHGAKSVDMIQRSVTCVLSREFQRQSLGAAFPTDIPLDVVDFKTLAMPFALQKQLAIASEPEIREYHKEIHEKCRRGGLKVNLGPEGQGLYILYLMRSGGYWTDKGEAADMIEDGRIRGHNGIQPQRFTERGIVMSDGVELEADLVVFATGYVKIREVNKDLLGEDVIDQTEEVFGMDEEGEIAGSYRPCGHPGLWFATGDFHPSRSLSKTLALQIKAIELGLLEHDGTRDGAIDKDQQSRQ